MARNCHKYATGGVVWYLNDARMEGVSPKLQPAYLGPCLIIRRFNDLIYEIQLARNGKSRVAHHNKLKPFEGKSYPKWIRISMASVGGDKH